MNIFCNAAKLFFVFILVFGLYACNIGAVEPVRLEVDQESIEGEFLIDEFDLSKVRLIIIMDDDSQETINVDESMVSQADLNKLSETGLHEITVTYQELMVTFTVFIIEKDDPLTLRLRSIYDLSTEAEAFDGTYEEWLKTVIGPQGEDGSEVSFRVSDDHIQWQYAGEEDWTNLIELASLIGPKGESAEDGVDGREIVMQVSDTHIQWQYDGDETWKDLIAIKLLIGPKGEAGEDGSEVSFRVSGDHIQWQYIGEDTWTNLIELSALTGIEGVGIESTSMNEIGELIITYTNGTEVNIGTIYRVFTVNFVGLHGHLIDSQIIVYGADAIEPTPPVIEGYIFTKWTKAFTNVTANITVVADYDINTYTITLDTDGGAYIDPISDIEHGADVNLPIPIKDGYDFKGWFTGTTVNDGQFTNVSIVTSDMTLHARWEIVIYTVKFLDVDDNIVEVVHVVSGDTVTAPEAPTILGYTFSGWTYPFMNVTKDTITKTTYSLNQYTITFHTYDNYCMDDILLEEEEPIVSVSLGVNHSSAMTSEGKIFTWGYNWMGQLGDNTTTNRHMPTDISAQFNLNEGETIVSMPLGGYHSSALTSEGRVFTWGYNWYGQLGDDTKIDRHTPTDISAQFNLNEGETIVSASLGGSYSSALTSEGRVFTWGRNNAGQLGDGTITERHTPTDISAQFNLNEGETIVTVSLGGSHSSALSSEGKIFTWGNNDSGKLGDGTTIAIHTPTDISEQFNLNEGETIVSVSLGNNHSSAVTSEGRIFTWGHNWSGQVGDGTTTNKHTPTDISVQFNLDEGEMIVTVSLGNSHSSALSSEGRIFTWGSNQFGRLGDGTTTARHTPQALAFNRAYSSEILTFYYNESLEEYIPVREAHTFDGWYSDDALTIPYVFTIMPAEDITLYAKWIPSD